MYVVCVFLCCNKETHTRGTQQLGGEIPYSVRNGLIICLCEVGGVGRVCVPMGGNFASTQRTFGCVRAFLIHF